jgi:hypothetical protein
MVAASREVNDENNASLTVSEKQIMVAVSREVNEIITLLQW